ncbi:unnamed protein product [Parnassius apollo]|uniref:(apollo) hypothetical protein n=1 Tax=Parnassius apollo TaxID=110799 RepID=A0A8S3WG38_PARAO|nr:unnamed protein product [Parnassius apollo]
MRELMIQTGQQAHTAFKMWPSLVIGSILRDLEDSEEFFNTITADLPIEIKMSSLFTYETHRVLDPTQAMLYLEQIGLWKSMGHPVVDMDSTTSTWIKKGTFYKRHNKWPDLTYSDHMNPHILECILENKWGDTTSLKWNPIDFQHIQLEKNFEFNYQIDTIDIISDKAIIPSASEWIYEYDTKALKTRSLARGIQVCDKNKHIEHDKIGDNESVVDDLLQESDILEEPLRSDSNVKDQW